MSDLSASLGELIIESARDDIESFETLRADVARWASDDGIPYSDEAFVMAIGELVQNGRVTAFRFDQVNQQYQKLEPALATKQLSQAWFRTKR